MTLFHAPSVQSPAGYSAQNLQGQQLAARMAGTPSAAQRLNLRTAMQDSGYRYKIHPDETAAGLTDGNLTFGYEPGNVLRYGADPTGAVDCYTAVQNALKAALTGTQPNLDGIGDHGRIYFPRGNYKTATDGLFNNPIYGTAGYQRGIIIEGDGMASSQILLVTGGVPRYFYDNATVNTQQYLYATFRDLKLYSDNNLWGRFALLQSDQGWRYERCWFQSLRIVWETGASTVNGSEHKVLNCKVTDVTFAVFRFNNVQVLNVEFVQSDIESITGHIFRVESGGGGALRCFGGSWIMDDGGSDHYFLSFAGGGIGNNNNTYSFYGMQFELHATTTKLVGEDADSSGGSHVLFDGCNIAATNGARRQILLRTGGVTFRNSVLTQNQGDTYEVDGPTGGAGDQYGIPGRIRFVECDVPNNLSAQINLVADAGDSIVWGSAQAVGCYNSQYTPGDSRLNRYAIDFDLNPFNQGRACNGPPLKRISVKPQARNWPNDLAGTWDWIVNLPAHALIKNIYCVRPAGASGAIYELFVGNGDKSVSYGNDGGGLGSNVQHTIKIEKDWSTLIDAGTAAPGNQVRVWCNPAVSDNVTGGYFIVEYL